jgi:Ca2+-dependent lipid-binding protein
LPTASTFATLPRGVLHVTVTKATNLVSADANGKSDPFVTLTLLKANSNNATGGGGDDGGDASTISPSPQPQPQPQRHTRMQVHRTQVCERTLEPTWNEQVGSITFAFVELIMVALVELITFVSVENCFPLMPYTHALFLPSFLPFRPV